MPKTVREYEDWENTRTVVARQGFKTRTSEPEDGWKRSAGMKGAAGAARGAMRKYKTWNKCAVHLLFKCF